MAGKIQMVDTADDDKVERGAYKIGSPIPPIKPLKKLLVLDLNGILARTIYRFQNLPFLNQRKPDGIFGSKLVFKRPFCDEFLQFCFSKFEVGLWSTIEKHNVDAAIDFVMGDWKHKLLFTWYQSDSSDTGFKTLENDAKPLFLKELKKLWENENSSLPWSKGQFSSSNTLLIDDAPYTALKNPPNTAIFPHPYLVEHIHDNSIGPNGDLRAYLECLSVASNVPAYVEAHPFGQKAITATHPNWNFYSEIIKREREMAGVGEAQNRVSGRGPPPQMRGGPPPRPRFEAVDREKTCPLLLRVFTMIGRHHTKEDFAVRGKEPKDEVQIYTWKDATLRELTNLVTEVTPEARRRDAKLSFAFVYLDKNGRYVVRPVGMTHSYGIGRRPDDGKALAELSFQIGDYLDVAIL